MLTMRQSPVQRDAGTGQSQLHKHTVLIDTDIGDDIDDALALALALRSPEIVLQGVTTVFGDTRLRARLAAHLLQVFGREDVPVAAGIATPLQLRHRPSGVPQAAILDQRAELPALSSLSGPQLIVQTALAHHGRLTLLCLGPLTNVATALRMEPRLFMAIRSIVMMGGTSGPPLPEWNVRSDTRAAQIVLGAGIPITLLGWNVTTRCQLRACDIERLACHDSPQARLLSQLLAVWQRHRPRWQPELPYLHDPLTVVALCAPELLKFDEMTARVVGRGPFKGFMVPRVLDGPLVYAAVGIQGEQAREWVMRRLVPASPTQSS
jgi:purine nucleosidase